MSGQHCENYDVKRETVHCYPVNSSLLTAVARDRWNPSAVFKFCLCFVLLYNKSLNDWSLGEQWILFPRISMFPSTSSRETLKFSGNKIHCSPRDQSLSVKYKITAPTISSRYNYHCCGFFTFLREKLINATGSGNLILSFFIMMKILK